MVGSGSEPKGSGRPERNDTEGVGRFDTSPATTETRRVSTTKGNAMAETARERVDAILDAIAEIVMTEHADTAWAHHLREHGRDNGAVCERCTRGE